jgi:hypothetical protein
VNTVGSRDRFPIGEFGVRAAPVGAMPLWVCGAVAGSSIELAALPAMDLMRQSAGDIIATVDRGV